MLFALEKLSGAGDMKQAQVLTEKDTKRVLALIARKSFAARNRCMLQLSWLSGMRVGEIAALSVGDVLDANGSIRSQIQLEAEQTKGDTARTVLLNALAQGELATYLRLVHKPVSREPLFTSKVGKRFSANSLCQVFLPIYDEAGLDKATSHSGRRTFITTLAHTRSKRSGPSGVSRAPFDRHDPAIYRTERECLAGGGGTNLADKADH